MFQEMEWAECRKAGKESVQTHTKLEGMPQQYVEVYHVPQILHVQTWCIPKCGMSNNSLVKRNRFNYLN